MTQLYRIRCHRPVTAIWEPGRRDLCLGAMCDRVTTLNVQNPSYQPEPHKRPKLVHELGPDKQDIMRALTTMMEVRLFVQAASHRLRCVPALRHVIGNPRIGV